MKEENKGNVKVSKNEVENSALISDEELNLINFNEVDFYTKKIWLLLKNKAIKYDD